MIPFESSSSIREERALRSIHPRPLERSLSFQLGSALPGITVARQMYRLLGPVAQDALLDCPAFSGH